MANIQKQTYVDLILSPPFSDDYFMAKSITLDFLFGFDNPCTAIVYLNEYLSEDNHLASMGLNCVLGVLLAVEEYKKFYPTVIVNRFLVTLIHIMNHKLDDFSLENYSLCMRKIIEFIGNNINFKLLKEFVDIGLTFIYSEVNNERVRAIFQIYCEVLKTACKKLLDENSDLLSYKMTALKNAYQDRIVQSEEEEQKVILNTVYNILDSIDANKVFVISNEQNHTERIVNKLKSRNKFLKVQLMEKDEISEIPFGCEEKVIFLVDFKQPDIKEMLYLCGRAENIVKKGHFMACFYNCEEVQDSTILTSLIGCYSDESTFDDRLQCFLNTA